VQYETDSFAVALALLAVSRSEAVSNDLKADWSDVSNPNGPWSYQEGNNLLPHVSAWQSGDFVTAQSAWARAGTGTSIIPAWFKSSGTLGNPLSYDWLDGDIVIHTTDNANGVGSGPGNVTWTSPLTGFINISGAVWMGRDIGRSNRWTLAKNGVTLTSGDVSSGDAYSRASPFYFANGSAGPTVLANVPVSPGDVLKLQLEKTSQYGDYIGVDFTIVASLSPTLTIARTTTNTVAVSWPSASTGWTLQQNTNSISSVNWSNAPETVQDDGTTKTLIVNPPTGNRFYRLWRQ
jgi:hypothetical protein